MRLRPPCVRGLFCAFILRSPSRVFVSVFFVLVLLLSIKRLDRKPYLQLAAGPALSGRKGSWQRRRFTRQLWPPATLLIVVTASFEGQRFFAMVGIHLQETSEQLWSCCCCCCLRRWRWRWRQRWWWWDQRGCKRSQPPPHLPHPTLAPRPLLLPGPAEQSAWRLILPARQ